MFLWFVGTAVASVEAVFRDPRFDHRLLVVGSILPLLDGLHGGPNVLHSVVTSVVLLVVLMIATSGRRPIRATLLGLPIGMFLHLVFDAAWGDSETFWWPVAGLDVTDRSVPPLERGAWSFVLEAIGLVLCVALWRRYGLADAPRRRRFARRGHLVAVSDRPGRDR